VPTPRSTTIRASEIGTYLYCQRAWHYDRAGQPSQNSAELLTGTELHQAHGRTVIAAGLYRTLGYLALLAALVLLTIYLAGRIV